MKLMANVWELIEDDTDAPFSKVNFCMALLSTSTAVDMMGLSKHSKHDRNFLCMLHLIKPKGATGIYGSKQSEII